MVESRAQRLWRVVAFASVGFFISVQPSEAYLTKILLAKGLSEESLDTVVWPADSYANVAFIVLVTALSDLIGQRPVIAMGLISWQIVCALIAFTTSVEAATAMQVAYAFTSAARVIYVAHVFSCFDQRDFAAATTAAVAAHHAGSVIGSIVGQLLVSNVARIAADLSLLVFLSWTMCVVALVIFIAWAPRPQRRAQRSFVATVAAKGVRQSMAELRETVSSSGVQWMAWWWSGSAATLIFGNYFQAVMVKADQHAAFGSLAVAIEVAAIVGAFAPVAIARLECRNSLVFHTAAVSTSSVLTGVLMFLMAFVDNVVVVGLCIVLVYLLEAMTSATANWTVAGKHADSRPSLVFGAATFFSLVLAAVVQAGASAGGLNSRQYMYVCGGLSVSVPLAQLAVSLALRCTKAKRANVEEKDEEEEVLSVEGAVQDTVALLTAT